MGNSTGIFIFVMGAAVGSLATWQYTKRMYERIAQEEINSVKKIFSKKEADTEIVGSQPANVEKVVEKPDILEYAARLQKEGYSGSMKGKEEHMESEPYVIYPEEFGELDNYETISLTYYADQILTDENDELIENVEDIIGYESLTHFGDFEDDSVFVRNDRLKCDYEILMDQRLYSDVIKTMPHRMEE